MTGASAGPRRLRVVTWNIRAGIGPGEPFPPAWWRHVRRERLAAIAGFLREIDPDVAMLQEVGVFTADGELVDEVAMLAADTERFPRYGAAHAYPLVDPDTGGTVGSAMWGNAVLTREALDTPFVLGLPQARDDDVIEPGGADHPLAGVRYADAEPGHREARCVVGGAVPGMDVVIATTHLTYVGRAQRAAQASAARVAVESAARGRPFLLTGDLNAGVDAPELGDALSGLTDAFLATGVAAGDGRRRSCGRLSIDHILTSGVDVLSCRVATEAGELSDHWPIVADLDISRAATGRREDAEGASASRPGPASARP